LGNFAKSDNMLSASATGSRAAGLLNTCQRHPVRTLPIVKALLNQGGIGLMNAWVIRSAIAMLALLAIASVRQLSAPAVAQMSERSAIWPPHPPIQRALRLTDMRVDVQIEGGLAKTTVRQTLVNDGHAVAEGVYMLPLPKGAVISDFALIDGDRRLSP